MEKEIKRYKRTSSKKEFEKQLNEFEEDAKNGKTICLTDLLINAETQHLKNKKKE